SKPVKGEILSAAIERWTVGRSATRTEELEPARILDSSSSIIDRTVIAELRGLQSSNEPGCFNHLIDLFVEDTPHRLAALRAAAERAQAEALAREAHALKGSSGHLGAIRMDALCEILENQSRSGSVSMAKAVVKSLEEEFERVATALRAEKKQ